MSRGLLHSRKVGLPIPGDVAAEAIADKAKA